MKQFLDRKGWMIGILAIAVSGMIATACLRAAAAEKRESVEARLQRLEDREEIRQLLKDYGRFLDQRDFASFSGLFAEKDGEWIGGMGKAKGSAAIRKLMDETIGQNKDGQISGPNVHLFTNEMIRINGAEATATTKWIFVVQSNDKQPRPLLLGHYEDTLVREQGRWKFLRRIVHGDIPTDDPLSRK